MRVGRVRASGQAGRIAAAPGERRLRGKRFRRRLASGPGRLAGGNPAAPVPSVWTSLCPPAGGQTVRRPPPAPTAQAAQRQLPGGAGVQPASPPRLPQSPPEEQPPVHGHASDPAGRGEARPALLDHRGVHEERGRQGQADRPGPAGEPRAVPRACGRGRGGGGGARPRPACAGRTRDGRGQPVPAPFSSPGRRHGVRSFTGPQSRGDNRDAA